MEQMKLYLVLGGLLIVTLMVASIAHRYHAYVEERRRQIERILRRVDELEGLLGSMQGVPAPAQALSLLQRDILARLEVVNQMHARHPGIGARLAQARARLVEAQVPERPPPELDERMLERLVRGLGALEWMLQQGRFVTPVAEDERDRLLQTIGMQRADSLYHYHRRAAQLLERDGQLHQALWHCNQVRQLLRDKGPDSEKTRQWYQEMDQRYQAISAELKGQSSGPSSDTSLE